MEDGKALERIGMDRGFKADLSSKIRISPGNMVSSHKNMVIDGDRSPTRIRI